MSAPGVAAVFAPERDTILTADADANIYEWDLGTGRCQQRAKDPWAVGIKCLAVRGATPAAPTPMLAVGTGTGNIDVFDLSGPRLPAKPSHSLDHLTTSVSDVCFHSQGELFAAFSREKQDQLRLVHAGTMTAFRNWPAASADAKRGPPLGRVSALDFSRRGGYMAIGNERGRVLLYQLRHYEVGK